MTRSPKTTEDVMIASIRCEDCHQVLLGITEKNGLTVWDKKCKRAYLVLKLINRAIEEGLLKRKTLIKGVRGLEDELNRRVSREVKRLLKTVLYKPPRK